MNRLPIDSRQLSRRLVCSDRFSWNALGFSGVSSVLAAVLLCLAFSLWADEKPQNAGTVSADASAAVSFKDGSHGWKLREHAADGKETLRELTVAADALALPVNLPKSLEYVLPFPQKTLPLENVSALNIVLKLPQTLPPKTILTVFSKDNDFLWRQMRIPTAALPLSEDGTAVLRIPVAGKDAAESWDCAGHSRPWNGLTAANLLEMGFRFELDKGDEAVCTDGASMVEIQPGDPVGPSLDGIRDLSVDTLQPVVGTRIETTFAIDGWIPKPYDPKAFSVMAKVTLPEKVGDAASETVRGFYYEDFLYDETDAEKTSCLKPVGEPRIKVRYCPRQAGRHVMDITVTQGSQTLTVPSIVFDAQPAAKDYHGFVRVDPKHTQYFCCDDGTVFNGLGMNVRSPFDDRYFHVTPYSTWTNQGLQAYETLFRNYRDMGINVAEVWMCSWWLALEWINDSPGFHGVGHYNQYRAWMLDRILQLAEENGIRLILVLNNHGKFGMTFDTEWARNPYNKANGGYLERCEHYFADARAKQDFKNTADYITARWGATPNLLAWKLFTEVDLTGQDISAYQRDPNIAAWHREMGGYLKTVDIYKHPVTTHWMLSYGRIDHRTASVKELDFLSTDAYYNLGAGSSQMMDLITGAAVFGRKYNKPLVITEFGGSSYGDSMRNLMNQVQLALYTGFFHEMGIVPLCWWFALIEDKQLHGNYSAYHAFTRGEDRRGMTSALRGTGNGAVRAYELRNDHRLLYWVMDTDFFFSSAENAKAAVRKNLAIQAPPLPPGEYTVEYWNLDTGTVTGTAKVTMPADKVPLPEFSRTLGVKICK